MARSLDAPHHADMPWHRTPQEAFAEAGVRVECDLDGDPAYEYSVCVVTERKRSGCFGSLFRGGRVARRRERLAPPRAPTVPGTRPRHEHVRVVPVGRPRDAPFASIASAADVASLEAMRAELDSTSSALEEALDAREHLAHGGSRPRVWAPASPRFSSVWTRSVPSRRRRVRKMREGETRPSRAARRRNIRRARRACRRPGDLLESSSRRGPLRVYRARARARARLLRVEPARCRRRGDSGREERARGGPGTRARLRTETRRGERRRLIQKRESITHVRYERKRKGRFRASHVNVLELRPLRLDELPPRRHLVAHEQLERLVRERGVVHGQALQ